MSNLFNAVIPRPAGIPETVEFRIVAARLDGTDLTREELEALRAVYPPAKASAKRAAAKRPSR